MAEEDRPEVPAGVQEADEPDRRAARAPGDRHPGQPAAAEDHQVGAERQQAAAAAGALDQAEN